MKVLVVGGGGREHAVIKKLKENPEIEEIYALPGNGGIAEDALCVPIGAKDIEGIVSFAAEKGIGYAVVTPDDPLVLGCVDALEERGIPCFGPRANAAIIEGSKVFAKNLMKKYGIPTARFESFDDPDEALRYLESAPIPTVVKADGLALGKGVMIAQTREEAVRAVTDMMCGGKFGKSGERVVIEEYLEGPEVSVLAFTDGDGDTGLNTGGMGTVAPNPYYTPEIAARCMEEIFLPTVAAMNKEGRPFKGCLYFGLMLTKDGPKVIEYNCRFGDPETQVVLPLLESDLFTVMRSVTEERLAETEVRFQNRHACCVILASKGYPEAYDKGFALEIPEAVRAQVYVAGAARKNGRLVTNGGRVVGCTAVADTLQDAVRGAYAVADQVSFENKYCRRDIGARALAAVQEG